MVEPMVNLFLKGVRSVQMSNLFKTNIQYCKTTDVLSIFDYNHNLKDKEIYVVGAGKAAFHMAREVENILGSRLKYGIVSVPIGVINQDKNTSKSIIDYYEGAKNNLPDNQALQTTLKIIDLVKKLDENSILIVLLSGGGSALLPSPLLPVTLEEKYVLINNLAKAGADIIELNTVRKRISSIKGGKLSILAYPAEVITLMVSDILRNNAASIASGPTFADTEPPSQALKIVKKYKLFHSLPSSIKHVLQQNDKVSIPFDMKLSYYMLGHNLVALYTIKEELEESKDYTPFIVSHHVHGNVEELSLQYCKFILTVIQLKHSAITKDEASSIFQSLNLIGVTDEFLNEITQADWTKSICLIGGGEPTVKVQGTGKGGRNQHLALKFSVDINFQQSNNNLLDKYEIHMLCAGTDGIDGPTDAAGGFGFDNLPSEATKQNLNIEEFLNNNDSYNFYSLFCDGKYHIKTGHTNTNVMDLHLIVINPKNVH